MPSQYMRSPSEAGMRWVPSEEPPMSWKPSVRKLVATLEGICDSRTQRVLTGSISWARVSDGSGSSRLSRVWS